MVKCFYHCTPTLSLHSVTELLLCSVCHTSSRRHLCYLVDVKLVQEYTELERKQEGLAVASIARDDPSTLPGNDPFARTRMHLDHNAR